MTSKIYHRIHVSIYGLLKPAMKNRIINITILIAEEDRKHKRDFIYRSSNATWPPNLMNA